MALDASLKLDNTPLRPVVLAPTPVRPPYASIVAQSSIAKLDLNSTAEQPSPSPKVPAALLSPPSKNKRAEPDDKPVRNYARALTKSVSASSTTDPSQSSRKGSLFSPSERRSSDSSRSGRQSAPPMADRGAAFSPSPRALTQGSASFSVLSERSDDASPGPRSSVRGSKSSSALSDRSDDASPGPASSVRGSKSSSALSDRSDDASPGPAPLVRGSKSSPALSDKSGRSSASPSVEDSIPFTVFERRGSSRPKSGQPASDASFLTAPERRGRPVPRYPMVEAGQLRFSQKTVSCCLADESMTLVGLRDSILERGWDHTKKPLLAVKMPDELLTSHDNRRLYVTKWVEELNGECQVPVALFQWKAWKSYKLPELDFDVAKLLYDFEKISASKLECPYTRQDHYSYGDMIVIRMFSKQFVQGDGSFVDISDLDYGFYQYPRVSAMGGDDASYAKHCRHVSAIQDEV